MVGAQIGINSIPTIGPCLASLLEPVPLWWSLCELVGQGPEVK